MSPIFTAACIQTNARRNIGDNLPIIRDQILHAVELGADFITLPECVSMLEPDRERLLAQAPAESDHPFLPMYEELARGHATWILGGTLAVKTNTHNNSAPVTNRCYLFSPDGTIAATYDKIHMFDVDLDDGETYRESANYTPGTKSVLTDLPWGPLGMTICYDLRFAYLYRILAQAGAAFLTIPSAFTRTTGEAHWHILLRARAIETGCFIIAPAQTGQHAEGRETYGHSLIVGPWGEILADADTDEGIITAEINPAAVAAARSKIPALKHDRNIKTRGPKN